MSHLVHGSTRCLIRSLPRQAGLFHAPLRQHLALSGSRSVAARAMPADKMVTFEPESLPTVRLADRAANAPTNLDLLLVAVTQEDLAVEGEETVLKSSRVQALDKEYMGALSSCVSGGGFEGKKGSQSRVVHMGGGGGAAKGFGLVGLGKAADLGAGSGWGPSCFQALGASVAALAKTQRAARAGVVLLDAAAGAAPALAQLACGALLAGYETTRFKSKPSPSASKLAEVVVMGAEAGVVAGGPEADAALAKARALALGNFVARYLVEAPPNICTPTHMAAAAAHIAALAPGTMKLEVLEKADCEAMNMGLYLGVAEASDEPPKFIHLTYTPKSCNGKKIALIGKGLTFDSGGYNIKAGPGSMIEMMKFDMGGAGATLGAARIIAALQPAGGPEVHFIVAACENMVAGHGLRPGDVLTSAAGKTVEVNNTDAEGRLTLADALWFAQEKCGATAIVDSATLTGACMIALGAEIAALYSPSDEAAAAVAAAAKATGEKVWRMPMEDNYFDQLKSPIADMKNTGSRLGGSITAALFLKQYVKEEVAWSHIDMAGPVWDEKTGIPTGFGATTLAEWVLAQ